MNLWKWTALALAGLLAVIVGSGQLVRPAAAGEQQPHMRSALVNLKAAKGQLEKASADKGGHRVKAIAEVDEAIKETQAGMVFDATH